MFQSAKIAYEKDEYIVAQFRKHWFVFFLDVFFLIPFALAPFVVVILTAIVGDIIPIQFNHQYVLSYEIFFSMMWLLITWVLFFIQLSDYFLDVLRVTNKRIIDIDQRGFFNRNIATMPISAIEDITTESVGIFGTLLKYGSVKIQDAGQRREFLIDYLADPEIIKATLVKLREDFEDRVQEVRIVQEVPVVKEKIATENEMLS